MACAFSQLHLAVPGFGEGPVLPRKDSTFASTPRSVSLASTALNSQSDDSDASSVAHSPKRAFSDARVLTVADLPLVDCASDESDAASEEEVSDAEFAKFAETATPSYQHIDNGGCAGVAGRVLMMRELPSLDEILGADSDEEWSSQDGRELFEDESASDADGEWD